MEETRIGDLLGRSDIEELRGELAVADRTEIAATEVRLSLLEDRVFWALVVLLGGYLVAGIAAEFWLK